MQFFFSLFFSSIASNNWMWPDKNRWKLNQHSDKSFSFLSADEIEKLKQENEKKIATITRETKKKFASTTTTSDNINNNDQFDINENEDEFYHNQNLIISQHEINDEDVRWVFPSRLPYFYHTSAILAMMLHKFKFAVNQNHIRVHFFPIKTLRGSSFLLLATPR